mmetsp:Transcript_33727/g.67200  ORF Transcript_33727/g.67200 Transcript_33727/m.67200 type:complete len:127 (+) Transcript_33727:87-467(+)
MTRDQLHSVEHMAVALTRTLGVNMSSPARINAKYNRVYMAKVFEKISATELDIQRPAARKASPRFPVTFSGTSALWQDLLAPRHPQPQSSSESVNSGSVTMIRPRSYTPGGRPTGGSGLPSSSFGR